MELTDRFSEALAYAVELHKDQKKKGTQVPYIYHLLGVASIVLEYGGDEDEAIGALLHDAIEDQGGAKTADEIKQRFGENVFTIVDGCTDTYKDPKPEWKPRKEAYIEGIKGEDNSTRLVSAADKLQNVRSLIKDYREVGEGLWGRFQGKRKGTLCYHRKILEAFKSAESSEELKRLLEELERAVSELEALVG
jgi:(p)ppGpp synthase/HD superfamily hydrolase